MTGGFGLSVSVRAALAPAGGNPFVEDVDAMSQDEETWMVISHLRSLGK